MGCITSDSTSQGRQAWTVSTAVVSACACSIEHGDHDGMLLELHVDNDEACVYVLSGFP